MYILDTNFVKNTQKDITSRVSCDTNNFYFVENWILFIQAPYSLCNVLKYIIKYYLQANSIQIF